MSLKDLERFYKNNILEDILQMEHMSEKARLYFTLMHTIQRILLLNLFSVILGTVNLFLAWSEFKNRL